MSLLEVPPGSKVSKRVPVFQLSDSTDISVPVIIIRGARSGPRLYVGAAIHADEINGVRVIGRLAQEVDPSKLSGSLHLVPAESPAAFRTLEHWPRRERVHYEDPYNVFPGKAEGTPGQRLAHFLYGELISKSDYAIDLHAGATGSIMIPHAFIAPPSLGDNGRKSEEIGRAFGTELLLVENGEHPAYLHYVATTNGIPAIGVELGEGGRLERDAVETGLKGVRNVMRYLGMIKGTPERPEKQHLIVRHHVRASKGGLVEVHAKVGECTKSGDVIAEIYDVFGNRAEEIRAIIDGIILRLVTYPIVDAGDRVVTIAEPVA